MSTTAKLVGVVERLLGKRAVLVTKTAAKFDVDSSQAKLQKKNGSSIEWSEVWVGDKLEIVGQVWQDNSVSAEVLTDLSLYAHKCTLVGTVTAVMPDYKGFKLQNSVLGEVTVKLGSLVDITLNGRAAQLQALRPKVKVKLKGSWERDRRIVYATQLELKTRKVKVEIAGELVIKDANAITVVSGGVIYGVDIHAAKIINKSRKVIGFEALAMGGTVRVRGRHLSGDTHIEAAEVREQ